MLGTILDIIITVIRFVFLLTIPVILLAIIFIVVCFIWYLIFTIRDKRKMVPSGKHPVKYKGILYNIFVEAPRRFMLDKFERERDQFPYKGIHMFCGEQGSGKTISCVEKMLKMQKEYPKSKMISNFGIEGENDELNDWHQLLDYTNGKQGVIVGIDEIQNWFQSGQVKMPPELLELVTQNRKNSRILCCTAQVFTRVHKSIREQVTMVYQPHTFLGCITVVIMRKPEFDSEGNVTQLKYRGLYSFVHTDKLRKSYDTYKVIHTLSKEGFKEINPFAPIQTIS